MPLSIDQYDIPKDALAIQRLLKRTLDRIVALYDSQGIPLPTRRFWTMGPASVDCEQVVVSFIQGYLGGPGDQASTPQRCGSAPRSAVIEVHISRDVPIGQNGKAVAVDKIMAAADWSAIDAWVLLNNLDEFDRNEFGQPGLGIIATVMPQTAPQGGVRTTRLQVTMGIFD